MNQAHLSIGEKKYELAINLYQNVLTRFLPNDLKTEMYLAKAHFMKGEFEYSKHKILKLIAHYPHYIPLKFNLALCLFNQGDKLFNSEIRRVHQTKEAIKYLRQAQVLFQQIQQEYQSQYSYVRTADIVNQEQRDAEIEQYKHMESVADMKIYLI